MAKLPWTERVNAISINPDMATRKDIADMAAELNDYWMKELRAIPSPVKPSPKEEAIQLCEQLIELAEHGNYSNGNTDGVIDEGTVLAMRRLNELKVKYTALQAITTSQPKCEGQMPLIKAPLFYVPDCTKKHRDAIN